MNWLASLLLRLCAIVLTIGFAIPLADAAAQLLPVCSWPFESDGRGITNVFTPDTNATYWIMPFDTGSWQSMIIRGRYPAARFINFDTYTSTGAVTDSIIDSNITPDQGSTNPFATQMVNNGSQNYTIAVGTNTIRAPNSLHVGGSRMVFVIYRAFVPDQGFNRTGGVGLPAVTLVAPNGTMRRLRPCPFANAETSLGNLITLLGTNGFTNAANFLRQILTALNQRLSGASLCTPGQPGPAAVTFAPATLGANFFANPQTTYLETSGLCFQPNKIIVVRGKAPVFPNTYYGGSIFQPAFDSQIQLRYWSMCNNDRVLPYPVVACQADFETNLDQNQFYTYVVSNDPAPPPWLPDYATWLPWGDTRLPKNLIFRNLLPMSNFTVSGEYYPQAVFCDETVFSQQGWQACFR